jgi:hypothetical protein
VVVSDEYFEVTLVEWFWEGELICFRRVVLLFAWVITILDLVGFDDSWFLHSLKLNLI